MYSDAITELDCGCTEDHGQWFPCAGHMADHALARHRGTGCDCPRCGAALWLTRQRQRHAAHGVGIVPLLRVEDPYA